MSRRILCAFPARLMRSALWQSPDIVIFDEAGFWVKESESADRRCVDVFDFKMTWSAGDDPAAWLSRLKRWSPVWTRWVAHADQYELLYREALIYVAHLRAALDQLGVQRAVFHTGLSHHIDSSLLETACVVGRVDQVFLYANTVDGRLLPLGQSSSIEDREPLPLNVSDYDAREALETFRANTLARRPPPIGAFDGMVLRSPVMAVLDAYYLAARRRAASLLRPGIRSRTSEFLKQFEELGPREFRRLIAGQRRALRYLSSRLQRGSLQDIARQHGPTLLLAAHYQPEASSYPEGGDFHNHIDLVIRLRSLGYQGPILYKEHPGSMHYAYPIIHQTRVGMARSVAYYQRLEELGCVFVDPEAPVPIDSEFNRHCVPVTISGSIALERALLGMKTIVSGHPWYKGLPGTIHIDTVRAPFVIGDSMFGADQDLAEDALNYMNRVLSRRTIINAPGIGAGAPITTAAAEGQFTRELQCLFQQL